MKKRSFCLLFLAFSVCYAPLGQANIDLSFSASKQRKKRFLTFLKCSAVAVACAISAAGGYRLNGKFESCIDKCDKCTTLLEGCAEELTKTREQAASAMDLATKSVNDITGSLNRAHSSCLGIQQSINNISWPVSKLP